MDTFLQDLRYALRVLARRRSLAIITILTLAIGIGANTAIFSTLDAMLLRPLPFRDQGQLVRVRETRGSPQDLENLQSLSPATYRQWRTATNVFDGIGAATGIDLNITGDGVPLRYQGSAISANFFRVLGIPPVLGRDFQDNEDAPGAERVMLLGFGVWQDRFGGDRSVLGKSLTVNGERYTIVGVMPAHLRHPYEAEMWVPLRLPAAVAPRRSYFLYAPARLHKGITAARAESELAALAARYGAAEPAADNPRAARVSPLRQELAGDVKPTLLMLLAGAAFLLLLGTANASSLLLVETLNRRGEIALRTALGASRARLTRQFLVQNIVLALIAAILGLAIAFLVIEPLIAFSRETAMAEFDSQIHADPRTIGFTIAIALIVGTAATMLPALRASGSSVTEQLRAAARSVVGSSQRRRLNAIVIVEIASSVVLLAGAAVVLQSFRAQQRKPLGFEPASRITFDVSLPNRRYPTVALRTAFVRAAVREIATTPGAVAVGASTVQPMYPGQEYASYTLRERQSGDRGGFPVHHREITPGYLVTLGIPVLRGRDVSENDGPQSPRVVLISSSMARHLWPGQDAIGRQIKVGEQAGDGPWLRVIGVVGDVYHSKDDFLDLDDTWYLPYNQPLGGLQNMSFVVEARGDPASLSKALRAAIAQVDPEQPIYNVAQMPELVQKALAQPRFRARVFAGFALAGLLLACVGLYGVLSFTIAQRSRELGVRMALGARVHDILRGLALETAGVTLIGIAIGTATAVVVTQIWRVAKFGVQMPGPFVYTGIAVVLCLVAAVAGCGPALRAARIDPAISLRGE